MHGNIALLVVDPDPHTLLLLKKALEHTNSHQQVEQAVTRQQLVDQLDESPPDLMLVSERGLAGLPLDRIFDMAREEGGIPVIILSAQTGERSALRLIRKGAADFVRLSQADRLPAVIERTLREHRATLRRMQLQSEVERAAGLMRENQRLSTLGRLATSIAHEINNPLEAISNLLFLISKEPELPPSALHFLELAQSELQRVASISKQTLNFYREAPAPLPVRLSELLEEVLVLYSRRIAESNLNVVREFEADDVVAVLPGEVRQVFSNLITNAIDASSTGGRLRLRVRKGRCWSDAEIQGIRVTIADTGTGIPSTVRNRLGNPFFTTKGQHGTGLGLWVTKSILDRYGGSLLLRTSTGEHHGTVFTVFLPTNLRPRVIRGERSTTGDAEEYRGKERAGTGSAKVS